MTSIEQNGLLFSSEDSKTKTSLVVSVGLSRDLRLSSVTCFSVIFR
jgi:hypothetical protein